MLAPPVTPHPGHCRSGLAVRCKAVAMFTWLEKDIETSFASILQVDPSPAPHPNSQDLTLSETLQNCMRFRIPPGIFSKTKTSEDAKKLSGPLPPASGFSTDPPWGGGSDVSRKKTLRPIEVVAKKTPERHQTSRTWPPASPHRHPASPSRRPE